MGLFLEVNDIIKVGMIYVSINTEQPFQNCLCYCDEVPWKGYTYYDKREYLFISLMIKKGESHHF